MEQTSKKPLWVYVLGVIVIWALILGSVSLWDPVRLSELTVFCGGFFLGMVAMYIAVHIYRWR